MLIRNLISSIIYHITYIIKQIINYRYIKMFINNFYQKLKWFILSMTLQEQKPKNRAQSKHAKVTVHFVGKKILAHWVLEIDERQKNKMNIIYHTLSQLH